MREGWKEVTIGDLGQVVTGNTPPKNDPSNYGGDYPFIKPTDMEIGRRYCTNWEENYSDKAFKRYKNSYIPPKSTGVVTIGTVGDKLFQADRWCFTNQSVNVIIPNTELYDEDFIYYLMKINLPKVENANPGTASGRHHVSKSNFCAIKVRVPENKETQKKIASILSGYDDLIENNLKRIKLLEEMAQQTYEEWFVRMRFPGHETAVINAETGLPEGWEKVKLGDIISFKIDNRGKNPTYYTNEGIPVLDNHLITNSPFVDLTKASRFLDEALFENFIRRYLEKDDVLITLVGTVANITLAPKERCAIVQNTIGLRCNEKCNQTYLYQFLKNNKQTILNNNRGSAQPSVKVGDLLAIDLLLPPSKLLNEYDKYSSLIFIKIQNLGYQNQRLREARDILLPRLMMGMVEV